MHVRFVPRAQRLLSVFCYNITIDKMNKGPNSFSDFEARSGHTAQSAVLERSSDFEEFKESIIGRKNFFDVLKLRTALQERKITEEEYHLLLEVYVVQLEDDKKHLENSVGIDPLTGLADRLFLDSTISKLIGDMNRSNEMRVSALSGVVIITVDMKGLKSFNKYGQHVGDMALRAFAERLRAVVSRDDDKVFRSGGDEFTMVLPLHNAKADFDFSARFQEILQNTNNDLSINVEIADKSGTIHEKNLPLGAYMGYSMGRKGDGQTAQDLIKKSSIEMARNKSGEKGEDSPLDLGK